MLAIIGGSGLYQLEGLEISQQLRVVTPFGQPSDLIYCGSYTGQPVLFLSRHGQGYWVPVLNHRVLMAVRAMLALGSPLAVRWGWENFLLSISILILGDRP